MATGNKDEAQKLYNTLIAEYTKLNGEPCSDGKNAARAAIEKVMNVTLDRPIQMVSIRTLVITYDDDTEQEVNCDYYLEKAGSVSPATTLAELRDGIGKSWVNLFEPKISKYLRS